MSSCIFSARKPECTTIWKTSGAMHPESSGSRRNSTGETIAFGQVIRRRSWISTRCGKVGGKSSRSMSCAFMIGSTGRAAAVDRTTLGGMDLESIAELARHIHPPDRPAAMQKDIRRSKHFRARRRGAPNRCAHRPRRGRSVAEEKSLRFSPRGGRNAPGMRGSQGRSRSRRSKTNRSSRSSAEQTPCPAARTPDGRCRGTS